MSFLDCIFTTSSCYLSTSCVYRYFILGCFNIYFNYYYVHVSFLKGIHQQFALLCLEELFILKLILMAHINLQTSEKSKRQVSSIVLVSISFVVFCGIIFYHVWNYLLKSHSQKAIEKVKKIFKKYPPPSKYDDTEIPLIVYISMFPESSSVQNKPTSTTISSIKWDKNHCCLMTSAPIFTTIGDYNYVVHIYYVFM